MQYRHTQTGGLHLIVVLSGAITLLVAWFLRGAAPILPAMLTLIAAMTLALAFCFKRLTVEDEGDRLAIRFGPLPLFGKTVRYSDITGVEPGRTSFIDGWGIHYVPGRGSTWNLWGSVASSLPSAAESCGSAPTTQKTLSHSSAARSRDQSVITSDMDDRLFA